MEVCRILKDWSMANHFKNRKKSKFLRPEEIDEQKTRILIVCEGQKTEPDYFKAMCSDYKISGANIIIYNTGDRSSPKTVVDDAVKYNKQHGSFDAVYCVFDKDGHGKSYEEALNRIKSRKELIAIHSVPCFEFWILLHFDRSLGCWNRYADIEPDIKSKMPGYNKAMTGLYDCIKDYTEIAIQNAKYAEQEAERAGTDMSTTKIYLLVEKIKEIAGERNR